MANVEANECPFFLFFLPPLLFSPLLHNPLLALFPQGKCTAVHIVEEGSAPGIIPPLSPSLPPCRNERNKNYSRAFLGKEEGGWGGRRLCGIERERGKGRDGDGEDISTSTVQGVQRPPTTDVHCAFWPNLKHLPVAIPFIYLVQTKK